MAKTLIKYDGKSVIIDDSDIFLIFGFLVRHYCSDIEEIAPGAVVKWRLEMENSVPGALNLELDELFDNIERSNEFVRVLQDARAKIESYGHKVSSYEVNEWVHNNNRFDFQDQESSRIRNKIEKLIGLFMSGNV